MFNLGVLVAALTGPPHIDHPRIRWHAQRHAPVWYKLHAPSFYAENNRGWLLDCKNLYQREGLPLLLLL